MICCPFCLSVAVATTNGTLRCGQCGQQVQLPGGIRLKTEYPKDWIVDEEQKAITGFEKSPSRVKT